MGNNGLYIRVIEKIMPSSSDKAFQITGGNNPNGLILPVSHVETQSSWFSPNHVVRLVAEFKDFSLPLFYHPSDVHSCLNIALDLAAAYAKFGLIAQTTGAKNTNAIALAASASRFGKRGLMDIPGHVQDAFHAMFDLGKFPQEGYYEVGKSGIKNLVILGKVKQDDILKA